MKHFLDLKVGDRVLCLDEYSGGTSYHELIIDSMEDDPDYATESNPLGRRYFGTDQDYLDENGEFDAGDNEYLTVVDEATFVNVIEQGNENIKKYNLYYNQKVKTFQASSFDILYMAEKCYFVPGTILFVEDAETGELRKYVV